MRWYGDLQFLQWNHVQFTQLKQQKLNFHWFLCSIRFGSNRILKWNDLGENRTHAEFPYVYAGL